MNRLHLSSRWQSQFATRLLSQDFRYGMSDRHTSFLSLLLRQASGNADLQCGLQLPVLFFAVCAGTAGHALETSDEDAVSERL